MLKMKTKSRVKFGWVAGLGAWMVLGLSLAGLAPEKPQLPPPVVATRLHDRFPALHGQILSLKYVEALNSYRVRLISPQGQIFSYGRMPGRASCWDSSRCSRPRAKAQRIC